MTATLVEVDGGLPRQTFVLAQFPVMIGRGDSADVRLNDRWVSRHHCRLELVDGTVFVHDLGSRHGTLVNRSHIETAVVAPGDRITVGMTTFEIRYERIVCPASAAVR